MLTFMTSFISELRASAGSGVATAALLVDVGSNSGEFTAKFMETLRDQLGPSYPMEAIMIEPQERFHHKLLTIGKRWNGTLVRAAAWIANTTLDFALSKNSQASHIATSNLSQTSARRSKRVPAFDIGEFLKLQFTLRSAPRGVRLRAYVKIDIEGAEYHVLPRLLQDHVLCAPVTHLHIEWHNRNLPMEERRDGLALRWAIAPLLARGCPATKPAPRVIHEEFHGLNVNVPAEELLDDIMAATSGNIHLVTNFSLERIVRNVEYKVTAHKRIVRHRTYINGK